MSTEAKTCCARPRAVARSFVGSGLGLTVAVAAALLPKCPVCLAGYLAIFGMASAAGVLAPIVALILTPLAAIAALGSVAALVVLAIGGKRGRSYEARRTARVG